MPIIFYRPKGFPPSAGPLFLSTQALTVSWDEIAWAALTVGRRHFSDVMAHGLYSLLEAQWRLAMIWSNLIETPSGGIGKSPAFHALDRSEKGAISFFLGNVCAKLFCEKILGISWLLHLDVYRQVINPSLSLDGRPDFVGLDGRSRWIVIEAKGRTRLANQGLMDKAKRQTRCLRRIDGDFPHLRVAVASHFPDEQLTLWVQDPDGIEDEAFDLELTPNALLDLYYKQTIDLLDELPHEQSETSDGIVIIVRLPLLDASVEVSADIYRAVTSEDANAMLSLIERTEARPSVIRAIHALSHDDRVVTDKLSRKKHASASDYKTLEDTSRLHRQDTPKLDGVRVRLGESWRAEEMRHDPRERKPRWK